MRFLALTAALGLVPVVASADAPGTVTLTLSDGTSLRGKLVGGEGDELTVESPSLGLVRVPASKVVRVEPVEGGTAARVATTRRPPAPAAPSAAPGPPPAAAAIAAFQTRIASDPAVFAEILTLADDPDVMRIVQDPEVLVILSSGDLDAAEKHPGIQRLLEHPKMRALIARLTPR